MSKLIEFEEIRPGMVVYIETKPKYYPLFGTLAWDLEPRYIVEVKDDVIYFEMDFITTEIKGHFWKGDPTKIRYWTCGHPYLDQRKATPWPEEV